VARPDPVIAALILIVVTGLAVGLWRGEPVSVSAVDGASELGGVLGGGEGSDDLSGYRRVTGPRAFRFPADHAAHPDYRSEWWYYTGNLESEGGRRFGFQLTFFRFALAPSMPARESRWASRQAWMAHFAITDARSGRHYTAERFQRGALGLAGADASPLRIWLDDWQATGSGTGLFPLHLKAADDGQGLDLTLTSTKPLVLQGREGYSRKGADPGNASYYYSYTRLTAEGRLSVGGEALPVHGSAWLDREWSTSALAPEEAGWDWFALQFDDGRDLMIYRLRRRDGTASRWSAGVIVSPDGAVRHLGADDFTLESRRWWRSPETGVRYPVGWRVHIPAADLEFQVEPLVDNQEMNVAFRYWEGAVTARGRSGSRDLAGRGYLELTGYRR
jgi:predicted secreted hydrolase